VPDIETVNEQELVQETPNVMWIGEMGLEADADKLVVLVDEFRSGYECLTCLAKDIRSFGEGGATRQVSMVPCPECLGNGKLPKAGNPKLEVKCSECEAKGVVPCPDCGGRGGLVATPKQNESSPTTGKIVSIGPLVPEGKRAAGDRVLFSSYAGTRHDVGAKTREGKERTFELRIIRDDEVLMKIHGVLKLRQLKAMQALYTNA
jgi:co-chaperonin GroES (HSP10)